MQWQEQIKYFEKKYRVVAVSFQGHGASEKSKNSKDYEISCYGQVALGLLNHLQVGSCTWIGNSMGGVIGYEVLKTNPDRIKKLITNGTTPALERSSFSLSMLVFFDKLLMKVMGFNGYVSFASKHSSKNKAACDLIYKCMESASKEAIVYSHKTLGSYNYEDTMHAYCSRIYILWGNLDKGINGYLKKIDLRTVHKIDMEDAGHIFNLEDPQRYQLYLDHILEDKII